MATGIGNLPYPGKSYTPFDILTAEELNEDVANIESLATGTGQGDASISASAIDFMTFEVVDSTGTNSVSITAPGPGIIYVEHVKTYYNTPASTGAGSASINLPAGATDIFNITQSGGSLGAVTYATTIVAKRKFSIAAGGLLNITVSGSNGAGLISQNIVASFTQF